MSHPVAMSVPQTGGRSGVLTSLLLLLGGLAATVASLLPFDVVKHWVDPLAMDGSADWFTAAAYEPRSVQLRVAGLLLLGAGAFAFRARHQVGAALRWLAVEAAMLLRRVAEATVTWIRAGERAHVIGLAAVLVVGIVARGMNMGQPLRYDEAFTFLSFVERPLLITLSDYTWPNNHILNSLLMRVTTLVVGDGPWGIRLPAFLAGLAAIPATFLAFRGVFGETPALIGSALVAVSSPLIMFSTNGRGYTLVLLFFLLLIALGSWLRAGAPVGAWIFIAILAALGLYTIPVMLYPLGSVSVWLLLWTLAEWRRTRSAQQFRRFMAAMGAGAGLTLALYLPVMLHTGPMSIVANEAVRPRSWGVFFAELPTTLGALWTAWHDGMGSGVATVFAVLALLSPVALLWSRRDRASGGLSLILATLAWCVPLLLLTRRPPYLRVWLFLLPLYFCMIGITVSYLVQLVRVRRPALVASACTIVAAVLVVPRNIDAARAAPETGIFLEAAAVADYLQGTLGGGDGVVSRIPSDSPLLYEFRQRGIEDDYLLHVVTEPRQRLLVVVNGGASHTLDGTMQMARITDGYTDPVLLVTIGEAQIFELRRSGEPLPPGAGL